MLSVRAYSMEPHTMKEKHPQIDAINTFVHLVKKQHSCRMIAMPMKIRPTLVRIRDNRRGLPAGIRRRQVYACVRNHLLTTGAIIAEY